MKEFDFLYARDSSGKIKEWWVRISTGDKTVIRVSSGLLMGKKTERDTVITEGKNIGKTNETTVLQQALSEAKSKWEKKKREGYKSIIDLEGRYVSDSEKVVDVENNEFSTIRSFLEKYLPKINTNKEGNLSPMKAQSYFKEDKKGNKVPRISFPCFIQPKINGVRCFAYVKRTKGDFEVKLFSKKGLEYPTLVHIIEELKKFASANIDNIVDEIYIDGELYIHNTILSEITSSVRVNNLYTNSVQFMAFDIAFPNKMEINQFDRIATLFNWFKQYSDIVYPNSTYIEKQTRPIIFVSTKVVNHHQKVEECFEEYLKLGYEGAICRDMKAIYKFGERPQTMVKLKRRESNEFTIVDVIDTRNNPGIAVFVCENDITQETFKVNPEGSIETKKGYFNDRLLLIGKCATVLFYERTITGLPFHATLEVIRDYE